MPIKPENATLTVNYADGSKAVWDIPGPFNVEQGRESGQENDDLRFGPPRLIRHPDPYFLRIGMIDAEQVGGLRMTHTAAPPLFEVGQKLALPKGLVTGRDAVSYWEVMEVLPTPWEGTSYLLHHRSGNSSGVLNPEEAQKAEKIDAWPWRRGDFIQHVDGRVYKLVERRKDTARTAWDLQREDGSLTWGFESNFARSVEIKVTKTETWKLPEF